MNFANCFEHKAEADITNLWFGNTNGTMAVWSVVQPESLPHPLFRREPESRALALSHIQRIFPYSCGCGRENRFIKKNATEYAKGEINKLKFIKEFLPHPSELVLKDDNVKVTLRLSRRSIDFFKREAKKQSVPYQKMIRALVDIYAERLGK